MSTAKGGVLLGNDLVSKFFSFSSPSDFITDLAVSLAFPSSVICSSTST